jgi:hypothetical protein
MRPDRDEALSRDEQEQRIRELKEQAEQAIGGDMLSVEFHMPGAPPGIREKFWENVLAWEKAPWTSEFEQLRKQGLELPPPDQLDDANLSKKLWELVDALARRNVFIDHTDHLSDRQLYEQLYKETLHEATKDVPLHPDAFSTIDMIGSGSDEDVNLLARFYADEQEREHYREFFPDGLPQREPAPFDRDRHLPQPRTPPFADGQALTDEP